ncbi:MAG: flagellar hook-length control protein FliK [Selenomonas sp.]|nr:flagellar hook-length control protein FliK [Selenomonas sp.]
MALIDEKVSPERASLTATVKESVLSQSVSPAATVEESVSPQSVSPAATVPSIPATSKFVSSLAASAEELVPLKILAGHEVEQQGNISSLLSAKEETQQPEIASRINLQSLLPQSAEEAQRNDNFLAMLSGRQVKMVSSDNLPSNMLNQQQIQGQGMDFLQGEKPATLLDAQLNDYRLAQQLFEQPDKQVNTAQGEDKAAVIQGGQIPKSLQADTQMVPMKSDGLALAVPDDNEASIAGKKIMPLEQNEGTMTSGAAERVNDSATSGAVSRVMLPKEETVQLNVRKEAGQVGNDSLLNGKALGDTIPVAADNTNMQQDSRQGSSFQQNQSFSAMMETVVTEEGKAVEQLTEEAVGDKAPAPKQASTNSESVTMFQQNLNESLNGTRGTDNIGQSQQVRDDFNVPRQIVEQARLLRRGEDTQMVIKLHPDHLGELTLKVSVSANGAVNASFHSDNAQVRAIIENTLVQLKQELNNQGLKVDNVDVYAGFTDGQLPQGEGQQEWQQNQQHGSSIRNIGNMDDYGEDTDTIVNTQDSTTEVADGVDYRI